MVNKREMERRLSQSKSVDSGQPTETKRNSVGSIEKYTQQNIANVEIGVLEHYEQKAARPQSSINSTANLRAFDNWVKATLINYVAEAIGEPMLVLDFCGGSGGDLQKWRHAKISYLVLLDQSTNMITQAVSRYTEINKQHPKLYPATFIIADATQDIDWAKLLPVNISFDLVSSQFAMHYAFSSEQRARGFISNIAANLKPNGYLILTIPDANEIIKRWRESKSNTFGNSLYQITFEDKYSDSTIDYGVKYTFRLADSIENCPEYLVDQILLEDLANEYGLEIEMASNFSVFYNSLFTAKDFASQSLGMKISRLSPAELDVAELYKAIRFKRIDSLSPKTSPRNEQLIAQLSNLKLNGPRIINQLNSINCSVDLTCSPQLCSNKLDLDQTITQYWCDLVRLEIFRGKLRRVRIEAAKGQRTDNLTKYKYGLWFELTFFANLASGNIRGLRVNNFDEYKLHGIHIAHVILQINEIDLSRLNQITLTRRSTGYQIWAGSNSFNVSNTIWNLIAKNYIGPIEYKDKLIALIGSIYSSLGVNNIFLSVPPKIVTKFDIECFGSPFNVQLPYFSPFPELEKHCGSLGDFFSTELIDHRTYLFNPVFEFIVIDLAVNRLLSQLTKLTQTTVFVVLPIWDHSTREKHGLTKDGKHYELPAIDRLMSSKFMIEHRAILDRNKYPYYDYVTKKKIPVAEFHAFILGVGKPKFSLDQLLDDWST